MATQYTFNYLLKTEYVSLNFLKRIYRKSPEEIKKQRKENSIKRKIRKYNKKLDDLINEN